jgi:hypothetical protein
MHSGGKFLFICQLLLSTIIAQTSSSITVTSPNGGEQLHQGDTVFIQWQAVNSVNTVRLEISIDGGKTYHAMLKKAPTAADPEWLNASWQVPDSIGGFSSLSSQCLVRISNYLMPSIYDESDAVFSIVAALPPVQPVAPDTEKDGCGSGAGLALLVPLLVRFPRFRRKRRN